MGVWILNELQYTIMLVWIVTDIQYTVMGMLILTELQYTVEECGFWLMSVGGRNTVVVYTWQYVAVYQYVDNANSLQTPSESCFALA